MEKIVKSSESDFSNNVPNTWDEIYRQYIKDASEDYIYLIDWLRKNYNTPIKKIK
jgi:hypothetical protein